MAGGRSGDIDSSWSVDVLSSSGNEYNQPSEYSNDCAASTNRRDNPYRNADSN